jgi:hypothetical protein
MLPKRAEAPRPRKEEEFEHRDVIVFHVDLVTLVSDTVQFAATFLPVHLPSQRCSLW